jgi:hypothetical protein
LSATALCSPADWACRPTGRRRVRAGHAVVHRQVGDAGLQQHVLAQQRVAGVLARTAW